MAFLPNLGLTRTVSLIGLTVDIESWKRLRYGYKKRQKNTWTHYEVGHLMSWLIADHRAVTEGRSQR